MTVKLFPLHLMVCLDLPDAKGPNLRCHCLRCVWTLGLLKVPRVIKLPGEGLERRRSTGEHVRAGKPPKAILD